MSYKIVFVDEEIDQQEIFTKHFKSLYPGAIISCEFPLQTVEEMLDQIWSLSPDAIVTDFQLSEIRLNVKYTVKYNGIDLLRAIRAQREDFPCFVITSFDDQAVNVSDDVNLVYGKSQLDTTVENEKVTFAARVIQQIDKYHSRIDAAKRELSGLINRRKSGDADVREEERIIELDTFLEKALGAENLVPPELKCLSNLKRLNNLIEKVDELLARVH